MNVNSCNVQVVCVFSLRLSSLLLVRRFIFPSLLLLYVLYFSSSSFFLSRFLSCAIVFFTLHTRCK